MLTFLVQSRWTELEAAARDIRVDRRSVRRTVIRRRRDTFNNIQEYREYLRVTGVRPWVIRYRVRIELLLDRIRGQILATVPAPTETELLAYYEANRDGFVGLTYEQVRARILEIVLSDRQTAAIDAFGDEFRARYRERTTCSRGFVISGVCNRRPG